jgi:hypothetical protein
MDRFSMDKIAALLYSRDDRHFHPKRNKRTQFPGEAEMVSVEFGKETYFVVCWKIRLLGGGSRKYTNVEQ